MSYPHLSNWQLRYMGTEQSQLVFWLLIGGLMLWLWFARNRWPVLTRVGIVVGYGVGLIMVGAVPMLMVGAIAGGLGYSYYRTPTLPTRLPKWVWLLGLALILRIPGLGLDALWYDETFTAGLAKLPLDQMFVVIRADVHPPLWYLIEWFTVRVLGSSEAALRLPALLFGVGSVLAVYRLAKAMDFDQNTALTAGALAALLPGTLYYSSEARGYTLLLCAVLGMGISLLENRPKWFILAGVVALYTHNLAWAYFGLLGLIALLYRGRSWLVPLGIVGAVGALWLPTLLAQTSDISDGFWIPPITLGTVIAPMFSMSMGTRMPESYVALVCGVVVGLTLWSLWACRGWILSRNGIVWAGLALAPGGIALASVLWRNVYLDRALLASVMAIVLAWAWALNNAHRGDRRVAWILLIPVLILSVSSFYDTDYRRADIRGLLTNGCRGADTVYNTTVSAQFITSYYLPSPIIWPDASDLNQTLPSEAKKAMGWDQRYFEQLPYGDICLVDVSTPLNWQGERDYIQAILDKYPHRTTLLNSNSIYSLSVHRINYGN